MSIRFGHGGRRDGAGRKPLLTGGRQRVRHAVRPVVEPRNTLSVTLRLGAGLPSLRQDDAFQVVLDAIRARKDRAGFRFVEFR